MVNQKFALYTLCLGSVAAVALGVLPWAEIVTLPVDEQWGLISIVILSLLSERLALTFKVGSTSSSASLTFILLFASVLLFGPVGTVLVVLTSGIFSQFLIQKKPLLRATFNIAQFVAVTALAGWVYASLGGTHSPDSFVFRDHQLPYFGFILTMSAGNLLAAGIAIALLEDMRVRTVVKQLFGPWGANLVYDILVSPVALLVAVLFIEFKIGGLVLAALTLFFIRRSYLTSYQLQQSNRDLLTVLVKAIETRDPYTSGHSVRVEKLARGIAVRMGLSQRRIESIGMAALLHDIGKIDEIYVDILRKEDGLTNEERRIIESHAVRGADLLKQLASVPDEVIDDVRHHHERVDGKGYPMSLVGDQIPLGARIIKVCDAIDAMLSDRPYRKALSITQVRDQLIEYCGTQFDDNVVASLITSPVLEEHERELKELRGEVPPRVMVEPLRGRAPARAERSLVG
ncbi:MAG: HD-GYP domain-containing protein [Planctomycetota bacterium]|jgi:putative nucleotidyltransferase with HDIG domain